MTQQPKWITILDHPRKWSFRSNPLAEVCGSCPWMQSSGDDSCPTSEAGDYGEFTCIRLGITVAIYIYLFIIYIYIIIIHYYLLLLLFIIIISIYIYIIHLQLTPKHCVQVVDKPTKIWSYCLGTFAVWTTPPHSRSFLKKLMANAWMLRASTPGVQWLSVAQISQFIVPGPNFLRQAPCMTSQSRTSPPTWTVTRCSTSFGGWTIASVRVLALVQLEIHSLEEKLWTFASTAGARWQMWATPFAPTSAFACASRTSALCPQPKDLQSAFASTKSLRVVMDGVASNSLTGLPALVTPSGSTTSSAWVWAFLPRKPMAVLCLLSRWRSCASRAEQSWPRLWREANCAPWWALACASGSSVLCHQQRELLCSCASTFSTRKGPQQSRLHMDLRSMPAVECYQHFLNAGLYFSPSLAAPQFWRWCGWSSMNVLCQFPVDGKEQAMQHTCIAAAIFGLWLSPLPRTAGTKGIKKHTPGVTRHS